MWSEETLEWIWGESNWSGGSIYAASLQVIKHAGLGPFGNAVSFRDMYFILFPVSKPSKPIDSLNWNWIYPFLFCVSTSLLGWLYINSPEASTHESKSGGKSSAWWTKVKCGMLMGLCMCFSRCCDSCSIYFKWTHEELDLCFNTFKIKFQSYAMLFRGYTFHELRILQNITIFVNLLLLPE